MLLAREQCPDFLLGGDFSFVIFDMVRPLGALVLNESIRFKEFPQFLNTA
jgi:hypothetical protein